MHYVFGMQIEHDPKEPPRDRTGSGVLWGSAGMVALIWLVFLTLVGVDWRSALLGGLTGGVFVAIMTEVTGNKVPPWMRG
ncbi:MAG: hypothetical protein E5X94_00580 [Mesorhizobium sp.]|nr:MAG: hypothetical protein E5X94_00580 [Mesorhizobium sp.]